MTSRESIALSEPEIADLLTRQDFTKSLRCVHRNTIGPQYESAFAAYRTADGIDLSETIVSTPDSSTFERNELRSVNEGFFYNPHNVVALHRILNSRTDEPINPDILPADSDYWYQDRRRDDVVLFLHSHPAVRLSNPEVALRPSTPDILIWENLDTRSPHTISAIMVAMKGMAKILLWRRSQQRQFEPRYHAVDNFGNLNATRKILENSGINTAVTTYSLRQNSYEPSPVEVAAELSR